MLLRFDALHVPGIMIVGIRLSYTPLKAGAHFLEIANSLGFAVFYMAPPLLFSPFFSDWGMEGLFPLIPGVALPMVALAF